jgi:hypothetical protein
MKIFEADMKINIVPVQLSSESENGALPEMFALELSGDYDDSSTVLQNARALLEKNGTEKMVASFDWAVKHRAFPSSAKRTP